ncbi:MAG: universal stress protein [Planctomycetes bacterium]|nr:universal stress protein [Planctomycetota bacterium]
MSFQRILCPTDFSPVAAAALERATMLARTFGAELILVHVVQTFAYPVFDLGLVGVMPQLQEEQVQRARERLEQTKAGLGSGLVVRTDLRTGDAREQVLAAARDAKADLIVMGTHGHTGLAHVLLGSTTERVVRLAECPVLTVRLPKA